MLKKSTAKPTLSHRKCVRCGVCCQKGGPALHYEDKALFEKGVIDLDCLYTIRKDELVYNNVRERLEPALSDIIKIKPHDRNTATCHFFNQETDSCEIYPNRPLECRVLKCWDVRESAQVYNKNRLTRKDILGRIRGLWELIEDHQTQCSYTKFRELLIKTGQPQSGDGKHRKMIDEMIGYDKHLRALMVQRNHLKADALDFILGRPLTKGWKMRHYYRAL